MAQGPSGAIFRTPDERFRDLPAYPFAPRYVDVNGVRMHYVDEGRGDPVLMLHGEPTWSYLYRKMIPTIAAQHRAVAPDYVGFGRSDKWLDEARYTFASHYANLEAFVQALDLRRITVVVQDWGGPLGLRLATQHPDRMARLVILNTGIFSGHGAVSQGLQNWIDNSAAILDRLSPGDLVRRSMQSNQMTDDEVRAYDAPFPDRESKAGVRRFPRMIPLQPGDPGSREMEETREALRSWAKPSLVMFSDSDLIFTREGARRFVNLIPGARGPIVIKGPGHFLQEERGEELAAHILEFMAST